MSSGPTPAAAIAFFAAAAPRSDVVSPSAAMWRFLMPVRAVIHSSVVSTIFARSSLVSTFAGRYPPTPRMTDANSVTSTPLLLGSLFAGHGHRLRGSRRDAGGQPLQVVFDFLAEVTFAHARRHRDRLLEALRVCSAMALHDNAVEPQEHRAIRLLRIQLRPELLQRRHGEQRAEHRQGSGRKGFLQHV